ncbi:MAG: sterol desaturase family protein [Elusimicrobia bacterium]|nr:sterol desaturase family protein [Elusimicrobiota bacterium]
MRTSDSRPLSPSEIIPDPDRDEVLAYDTAGWDRFLKTSPIVPALLYLPLASYWLWQSYKSPGFIGSTWVLFVGGLAFWTLLEYGIHRGLLHFADINALWNMGLARIHARHHEHPEDVSQVIISPMQTLPLAGVLWAVLLLVFSHPHADGVLAGITVGYLAYESFHYAFHAPQSLSWRWLNALRKYHARHHFETPDGRFGVTTPLWDLVFGS